MAKSISPKNEDLQVRNCPFCGSHKVDISNTHTACYTTSCLACGAEVTGPSFEKKWKTVAKKVADHLRAIRGSVLAWNRRVHLGENIFACEAPGVFVCVAHLESHILWGEGKTFVNLGGEFGPPVED